MGVFLALLSQVLSLCSSNELRNNKEGQITTYNFSFLSSFPSEMLHGDAYNELMMLLITLGIDIFFISNKDQLPVLLQKEKTSQIDLIYFNLLNFLQKTQNSFPQSSSLKVCVEVKQTFSYHSCTLSLLSKGMV